MPTLTPAKCLICKKIMANESFQFIEVAYLATDSDGNPAVVHEECYPIYREKVNQIITTDDLEQICKDNEDLIKS